MTDKQTYKQVYKTDRHVRTDKTDIQTSIQDRQTSQTNKMDIHDI